MYQWCSSIDKLLIVFWMLLLCYVLVLINNVVCSFLFYCPIFTIDFKFTTSIFLIWKSKRNIWLYSSYILLLLWPNPLIWATRYIGYTEMCNVTTASLSEKHYFRCWSPSFFLLYSGTAVYLCILNCMSTCPVPVPYYNKEKNIELSGHSQLNFL